MINYIFEPVNFKQAKRFIKAKNIDHIILGVSSLSNQINGGFSVQEINYLLDNKKNVKISLELNRIFDEEELKLLTETLNQINLEKVTYLFYSDLGVNKLVEEFNYQQKLVYDAYTYLTNYYDINAYLSFNKNIVVSNQISIEELKKLLNKVNKPVLIHGFGKSVIFQSKRKLLTNYFEYRNLEFDPKELNYYLQEQYRDEKLHIFENNYGSNIYESGYYYLFEELETFNNVESVIIHCSDLREKTYQEVVNAYLDNNQGQLLNIDIILGKGIMERSSVLLKEKGEQNV